MPPCALEAPCWHFHLVESRTWTSVLGSALWTLPAWRVSACEPAPLLLEGCARRGAWKTLSSQKPLGKGWRLSLALAALLFGAGVYVKGITGVSARVRMCVGVRLPWWGADRPPEHRCKGPYQNYPAKDGALGGLRSGWSVQLSRCWCSGLVDVFKSNLVPTGPGSPTYIPQGSHRQKAA